MDLAKDSVVNVITADNRHLRITISEKDSVIVFYYEKDKVQSRQISAKDKALFDALRKEGELKLNLQLRDQTIDSLRNYIRGIERIKVPD